MRNLLRCLLAGILFVSLSNPLRAEDDASLRAFFKQLPESPAKDALFRIPDIGRRLLALRSYSRAGRSLRRRWSWTEEEIKAYEGTPEQKALLEEVEAVAAHFAEANPGYQLYYRAQVRSLDVQIRKWNVSGSVAGPAEEILTAWRAAFGPGSEREGKWTEKEFWRWLKSFRRTKRPGLAAPGLSRHGQARAIDFQIMKDNEIIAGTSFAKILQDWRDTGWDEKLQVSIKAAGPSFKGPLKRPDEPWHYDYYPGTAGTPKE